MTIVMKFGGTSVGQATAIQETAGLIQQTKSKLGQIVVIASAMGSTPLKVTDLLLRGAKSASTGARHTYQEVAQQLRQIHYEAIDKLLAPEQERQQILAENDTFIDRYEALCQAVLVLGELTPRALDAISGMGEQMSVRILAARLRQQGCPAEAIDATELIVTDDTFQAAIPLMAPTIEQVAKRLQPLLTKDITPCLTGFIGATNKGVTTTLGRGGSDFSAAIIGQALKADEVWIWTDVDGVMTADPRLVSTAQSIPTLAYREVSELAYYGAKVLHPKTMRPCIENHIPLRIKNTFNPNHPGTVIEAYSPGSNGGVKAVTAINALSLITVAGKGMIGVPGIAARTFAAVARTGVNVLLITQSSSEQSICFMTPDGTARDVIANLEAEFTAELAHQDIDRIWAVNNTSIVTVVGAGMQGIPGIAGRIFSRLGQNQVNIIAIAQGSSECSISLVVAGEDTTAAVSHIHELIVPPQR